MAATSGFHERLVHCDVTGLKNVPEYNEDYIALKGSPNQLGWAASIRSDKMDEWCPDLPNNIERALRGIADATWWIANKDKDSANIGWPQSWTVASTRNPSQPELGQPASLNESRDKVLGSIVASGDIEQFDKFARKACQSPELAYLTMMAFLYRQTKDGRVLAKFVEARKTIGGHLEAIDKILGSPGE